MNVLATLEAGPLRGRKVPLLSCRRQSIHPFLYRQLAIEAVALLENPPDFGCEFVTLLRVFFFVTCSTSRSSRAVDSAKASGMSGPSGEVSWRITTQPHQSRCD